MVETLIGMFINMAYYVLAIFSALCFNCIFLLTGARGPGDRGVLSSVVYSPRWWELLSLYSTATQNCLRRAILRYLMQKIVLLRYLTQKIPTSWYLWR